MNLTKKRKKDGNPSAKEPNRKRKKMKNKATKRLCDEKSAEKSLTWRQRGPYLAFVRVSSQLQTLPHTTRRTACSKTKEKDRRRREKRSHTRGQKKETN